MTKAATRDTTSRHDLAECSRRLRRISESTARKLARCHEGEYVIAIAGLTKDARTSAIKRSWKVVGSNDCTVAAVEDLLRTLAHRSHPPPIDPVHFLTMPGNAEKRAKRVRELLSMEWKAHVDGTDFQNARQMYNVVRNHPDVAFGWWEHVTKGSPFTNRAVDDPEVSEAVFRYLAPRVLARMTTPNYQ